MIRVPDGVNPTLDSAPQINVIEEPNMFSGVPVSPGSLRTLAESKLQRYSVEPGIHYLIFVINY